MSTSTNTSTPATTADSATTATADGTATDQAGTAEADATASRDLARLLREAAESTRRTTAVFEHLCSEIWGQATEQAFADLATQYAPAADPEVLAAYTAELQARQAGNRAA
ncbi:hypothetical protein [Kitasatospora sp. NPDC090091]|uniref:hypothetical protein n=1 Tax=Kitasatospora sp. NPDC090091 TaxID=3364081 RepID=UPI0038027F2B